MITRGMRLSFVGVQVLSRKADGEPHSRRRDQNRPFMSNSRKQSLATGRRIGSRDSSGGTISPTGRRDPHPRTQRDDGTRSLSRPPSPVIVVARLRAHAAFNEPPRERAYRARSNTGAGYPPAGRWFARPERRGRGRARQRERKRRRSVGAGRVRLL